jgi:hypothetical protein
MAPLRRSHRDLSHHHPQIRRVGQGLWVWECSCGGAPPRGGLAPRPWPTAVVEALLHSQLVAP